MEGGDQVGEEVGRGTGRIKCGEDRERKLEERTEMVIMGQVCEEIET